MRGVWRMKRLCSRSSTAYSIFIGLLMYFMWTQTTVLKNVDLRSWVNRTGAVFSKSSGTESLWSTEQPPPHRDVPVRVILVSYQRTGSSFLGGLFALNPDAFYAFEPLDGLYVAMYGTSVGYNVPSDITTNWDGSHRFLTDDEIEATAEVLDSLLNCNHTGALPTEMLLHDFWNGFKSDHRNLEPFLQCLRENDVISLLTKECNRIANKMYHHCGIWYGKSRKIMNKCKKNLWPLKARSNASVEFVKYVKCIENRRHIVNKCVPFMENTCMNATIRASKVVRPTVQSLPILLQRHPKDLKIIHLFREPQSVAKSRQKYSSVRGHSSGTDLVKEAKIYCRDATHDLRLRKGLELRYPDSFMTVIYEEFVKNPTDGIHEVYKFLGKPVPEEVITHFTNNSFKPDDKSGWNAPKDKLFWSKVDSVCKQFYDSLGYDWSSQYTHTI